jgi:hypothetical protein
MGEVFKHRWALCTQVAGCTSKNLNGKNKSESWMHFDFIGLCGIVYVWL